MPAADAGSSSCCSGVTPSTKAARGFVYFSQRIRTESGDAQAITFTPALLAAIAPELEKVRAARQEALARIYPPAIRAQLDSDAYRELRAERTHRFDVERFPLHRVFAAMLGLDVPLDELHVTFNADRGAKGDRREKARLLQPLTQLEARRSFEEVYEQLVLEQLAPLVADAMGCDRVVYQAFPCVRVHRPGEFSIGPHCDAQYQHPDGTLNVYLPLTRIWDTNSLYVESTPGREDFHPLRLELGELATFYGALCTHFAVENMSGATRVSLDFRLLPGCCHAEDEERDFRVGEYYSECVREGPEAAFRVTRRGYAYWRHGFPHTGR